MDKYIAVKELHQEPIKFKTQFDWTYQLLDALDYIHNEAKMVHRDFKTDKFISYSGEELKENLFENHYQIGLMNKDVRYENDCNNLNCLFNIN